MGDLIGPYSDYHIINVHLNVPTQLIAEDHVECLLICSPHIFQAERHHFVAVNPSRGDEGTMDSVVFSHRYLTIADICVHEAQEGVTSRGVDNLSILGRVGCFSDRPCLDL